jgi:hypothetical protein
MHVALGWRYRTLRVRQGPVVYVCLEGSRGFRKRKEAFRRAKLTAAEDPQDPPFFLVTNPLALAKDAERLIEDINQQVRNDAPVVVCIDTLNRSLAGSENKDEDMGAYIRAADMIRDAFDCLVVIIHHSPHDGNRPRGHSSLIGACDAQIAVRKEQDNVVAELELAKDMEVGLKLVSRLEKVELGKDHDGDTVSSCVVREDAGAVANVAKKTGRSRRSDDVDKVKRAIIENYERLADSVEETPGLDGKQLVKKVGVDKLRDEVRLRGYLETNDGGGLTTTGRTHWRRAKTDLIASKRFIEDNKLFWRLTPDPPAHFEKESEDHDD